MLSVQDLFLFATRDLDPLGVGYNHIVTAVGFKRVNKMLSVAPRITKTNLQHRISACVFPLGRVLYVLRVSRESYPTRQHGAKPEHMPTQSVEYAMSPRTRNAKLEHRTRTFPILWDMIFTRRKWLEDGTGTNIDKLGLVRLPLTFTVVQHALVLPAIPLVDNKNPSIFYPARYPHASSRLRAIPGSRVSLTEADSMVIAVKRVRG